MLNGPSDHPVQLEAPKKSPIHFLVPDKIKCLTPANIIGKVTISFKISPLEGNDLKVICAC